MLFLFRACARACVLPSSLSLFVLRLLAFWFFFWFFWFFWFFFCLPQAALETRERHTHTHKERCDALREDLVVG